MPRASPTLPPPSLLPPSQRPLHLFVNDAVPWDPSRPLPAGVALSPPLGARPGGVTAMGTHLVTMAVRPRSASLLGVFVVDGHFAPGDLIGCYGGEVVDQAARERKRLVAPRAEDHLYHLNATHAVDPTSAATGTMADTTPPFRVEMAVVNEPNAGMPSAYPLEYEHGRCVDRHGALGVAYYAARALGPGEEVTVCYGPQFQRRGYVSTCADAPLLSRWSALQRHLHVTVT